MITKLGGRRYLMAMGCGMVCTLLVITDVIDPVIFRDIILGTVGAYILGNTAQKAFAKNSTEANA